MVTPVGVHDIDRRVAVPIGVEGDLGPVRRPGWPTVIVISRCSELGLRGAVGPHYVNVLVVLTLGNESEGDVFTIRGPDRAAVVAAAVSSVVSKLGFLGAVSVHHINIEDLLFAGYRTAFQDGRQGGSHPDRR